MSETNSGFRRGDVRAALHEAWCDLLDVDEVTSATNFYSAGGTSLTAASLLARMRGKGAKARLAELMACRTFAEQFHLFTADQAELSDAPESGLAVRQEVRLEQVARQIRASGTARVSPVALVLEIVGDVDHDLLIQSMVDLVRRHDALSIGFVNHEGEIAPTSTAMADRWQPEKIDLTAFSREQAHARIWHLLTEAAKQGLAFDTTALILGAVAIVRRDISIAVLAVDHMVCDGESLDILFEDFAEIYSAKFAGRSPDLPDVRTPAQDALVEADKNRVDDWSTLGGKWKDLLDGYAVPPAFDLLGAVGSRDYRATVPSPAKEAKFALPAGTTTKLKATCRQLGLPPLSIMLGATYLAAHIISGARDICVINPYSRRHAVGATHVVHDFAEPSVIRIRHVGTSCPCELPLAEVAAMAASSHATASELEMPFDVIMRAITPDGATTADDDPADLQVRSDDGDGPVVSSVSRVHAPDGGAPWLWCNYMSLGPRSRRMGDAVATKLKKPVNLVMDAPNLYVYIEDDGNTTQVRILAPEKLYEASVISEFGSTVSRILCRFGENPNDSMSKSGPLDHAQR